MMDDDKMPQSLVEEWAEDDPGRGMPRTFHDRQTLARELVELRRDNVRLTRENDRLRAALESLRRPHDVCDDCWYTCPLALDEDGHSECCNNATGFDRTRCTCGADKANAIIDAALGIDRSRKEK